VELSSLTWLLVCRVNTDITTASRSYLGRYAQAASQTTLPEVRMKMFGSSSGSKKTYECMRCVMSRHARKKSKCTL
jgi:hypothetical protein